MRIDGIIWLDEIVTKLSLKHSVETYEVEEALANKPKFRFVEKGTRKGEDVYMALAQTESGRYLIVLFIYKSSKEALILSSRDMAHKEKNWYAKK